MTDAAALFNLRRGNADALGQLIDRYSGYVGAVIRNIIGQSMTREDVEEAASDVFFALWRNASNPEAKHPNPLKLRSWLGAVARNAAKNKLRSLTGDLPLEEDFVAAADDDPHDALAEREELLLVHNAVLGMKRTERDVFLRHYYGCQSVAQIAAELNVSESAVKMRLSRGREKLRAELGGFEQ
jgi:RNA polymerase sigma-70 factor (ECF subfamily)